MKSFTTIVLISKIVDIDRTKFVFSYHGRLTIAVFKKKKIKFFPSFLYSVEVYLLQ